jgi:eukaryotic-like serine/threonine-protein kinase
MQVPEKLQFYGRLGLRLFILLAVAFLSAVTAIRMAVLGREVEVPTLVGMKAGDAQTLLASRRLGMKIADRVYNALPQDYVVRQSPPQGTRVKVQQRAHVVLSLGPQKVSVPSLVGETARTARIELLRTGLQVGEISTVYLAEREIDEVLQQNPPPHSANAGSPRVNLLVSQGERPLEYVMPDLVGLPLVEAQRRLSVAGLHLAKINFAAMASVPKASVAGQTPLRGAKIVAGTNIELQVVE